MPVLWQPGCSGSSEYFSQILERVCTHLDKSNTVTGTGTYMCQGKMPNTVRQRYESMLSQNQEKMKNMIENFERAVSHPDACDLHGLAKALKR